MINGGVGPARSRLASHTSIALTAPPDGDEFVRDPEPGTFIFYPAL